MGPRTCPHCRKYIPVEVGFHFDEDLNLIHTECEKIAFTVVDLPPSGRTPVNMPVHNVHVRVEGGGLQRWESQHYQPLHTLPVVYQP